MKTTTTTKTTISCHLDELGLARYDEQEEEHLFITNKPQDMAEAAQALGCSEDLIDSLRELVEDIKQLAGQDLRQIWERLDHLEAIVTKTKEVRDA